MLGLLPRGTARVEPALPQVRWALAGVALCQTHPLLQHINASSCSVCSAVHSSLTPPDSLLTTAPLRSASRRGTRLTQSAPGGRTPQAAEVACREVKGLLELACDPLLLQSARSGEQGVLAAYLWKALFNHHCSKTKHNPNPKTSSAQQDYGKNW